MLSFMKQQRLGTKRGDKSKIEALEVLRGTVLLAYCLLLWTPLNKTFFFSFSFPPSSLFLHLIIVLIITGLYLISLQL